MTRVTRGRTSSGEEVTKRQLLAALRALKRGDFSARLPDDLTGVDGQLCQTFNDLVAHVTEVGAEMLELREAVGRAGRTRKRLRKGDAQGGWARQVVAVNETLDDLTRHTDDIARVIAAVSRGDLSQTIAIDADAEPLRGVFLKDAKAVNAMVSQLALFGSEVTRVAREVGVNGKLGAQAVVPGVSGTWKELTENVNLMASNLTSQVREIARVTTAVAQGDLSQTVHIEVKGEILALKNTINTMVAQLSSLADEVTRVAREVGTEGQLGGQATVRGVSGVWRDLTENVNSMANNLTLQVRNIADVASAIAGGDLSKKITVEVKGEILELKQTINTMVDQLSSFAREVTRVARQVGTEGVLGGQAEVEDVSGIWQELTKNVNFMATNLTNQVRNIAEVITAVAEGDLSHKITVDAQGEILTLKNTINATVDKLNHFSAEVTRVARLVGTEGTLGVQAEVKGVSGIWKELTDNVNLMGRNLTDQVRDIAEVTTAVADGDLSRKITVQVKGEILALKNTINAMVDSLSSFADEVTRVAREVGTEGVLGGQAQVRDVSGVWKELTDNVNSMATNLTTQVRNISDVAAAVAGGDLSKKISVDARGEVNDVKSTINAMVDQLNAFAAEVTRVAREVGVEGKLGGQAKVAGVRGTWKELTDNVNLMAANLTDQVRDIAEVTTAVARGDLTRKIVVDAKGEILELKSTINTMVDQLSSFAEEVTKLASDVGIEGKLGGQADVRGVSGTWRHLTDAVNSMANNLTKQVRNISLVSRAIAGGDLGTKIVVDAKGEILELKSTINTMVDQLSSFADEVTRVAREVGTEGKLGGQASVEGVRGTWKELTDNVNLMATNLTNQVRDISQVATAIAQGELGRKVTAEVHGEMLELKNTINTMVDQLSSFADEVTRVARDVGEEGKLGGQAAVRGVSGIWKELTDNVNLMGANLTDQVRDIAEVTTAVANGDLSRKITVQVKGEILKLKNTINTMVDQLSSFADEVTRVAREVGTEGVLGGQAQVKGVSGTWRELTDNVNVMAVNLTEQVRGIARVVTAVADGDLDEELHLEARGEIATLGRTINDMIRTLSVFTEQVSGVARDVGVEGRLGGQADVPGAAGVWRDLTNNVNELAGNLTRQVRAIGDVATAVTKGDLTRSIDVEARGEVALLKDNLNQMIRTLSETTRANQEQDWLKTNLTRFTRMLQGQRDLLEVSSRVLAELAEVVDAQQGLFYMAEAAGDETVLQLYSSYAYSERRHLANRFRLGEGMVGQAALEKKSLLVREVPPDYAPIRSGLGSAAPLNVVIVPILFESELKGVIELASFRPFSDIQLAFIDQLIEGLGVVVATIEATMRTDQLLRRSQKMADELQTQQEELQQTNEELEEKARQLTQQKDEVEHKNREVELGKEELEEKAEQLALTSRYKSQFLANMSHELRTPLNSLLILSRQLGDNAQRHLDAKEVEYARTIHDAGADLLALINEILDLAKIESGTISIDLREVRFDALREYVYSSFRQLAHEKGLSLEVTLADGLPETLVTDDMRLRQVLRNLLSNALKFTEDGGIALEIRPVTDPHEVPRAEVGVAGPPIAFAVRDTGIGIPQDKQAIIFEAFQQAEGGASRKHGGTGLGLSISRELAGLLGGALTVSSVPGEGSVFTLYLPRRSPPRRIAAAWAEGGDAARPAVEEAAAGPEEEAPLSVARALRDDREALGSGDRVLLVVGPDDGLAQDVMDRARGRGMRCVAARGGSQALQDVRALAPAAVVMDLVLPDMNGWVLLDRLKHDAGARHIPVHVVVAGPAEEERALAMGALGALSRPVGGDEVEGALAELDELRDRPLKRLLLVEGDAARRERLAELLGGDGQVETREVDSGAEALAVLGAEQVDLLAVDLALPGDAAVALLREVHGRRALRRLPVIAFGDEAVPADGCPEAVRLARSPERLLDEAARLLHLDVSQLDEDRRAMLGALARSDPDLAGRKVLVVDDDVRNIFAITSLLEDQRMVVLYAENGRDALEMLDAEADIEVVLMDIMMPEMDGYEATRRIRARPALAELPVIALTAKAMPSDRERCLQAGASDYVPKPVDRDLLVSLLRVWLVR